MTGGPPRFRLGLVVGKFSPLHRGHEGVIAAALARCDRVLVLGYSQPEFEGCTRARRAAWIARRFPEVIDVQLDADALQRRCAARGLPARPLPDNTADDTTHQHFLAWLLAEVLQAMPDAMFASEAYLAPCCAVLAQRFGRPVAAVMVDARRAQVPISASRVRADVHGLRAWLAPEVYRDFVGRICFVGGESSGKTTLARAMAESLGTVWAPEYGRERWDACAGALTLADLIDIARVQIEREEHLLAQATRHLFCDTSPLTTLGYAGWMFGAAPPELVALAQRPYDLVVLCAPDFAFVQDGTRRDAAFRQRQHAWYLERLARWPGPWCIAQGGLAERMRQLDAALQALVTPATPGE